METFIKYNWTDSNLQAHEWVGSVVAANGAEYQRKAKQLTKDLRVRVGEGIDGALGMRELSASEAYEAGLTAVEAE